MIRVDTGCVMRGVWNILLILRKYYWFFDNINIEVGLKNLNFNGKFLHFD